MLQYLVSAPQYSFAIQQKQISLQFGDDYTCSTEHLGTLQDANAYYTNACLQICFRKPQGIIRIPWSNQSYSEAGKAQILSSDSPRTQF